MISFESIFGSLALITSFIGLMPQIYKAYRCKSTHDISMLMLMNYFICSFSWIVYGLFQDSFFVVASNVVGLFTSLISITQKYYYDNCLV